jgi:predicted DNA-binding transcriptional regulator AlpA
MLSPQTNRHGHRRIDTLRAHGLTEDENVTAPDREPSLDDPLLSAKQVCRSLGRISEMTLWRYARDLNFPDPDFVLSRRRFWRVSTVEHWLASQKAT